MDNNISHSTEPKNDKQGISSMYENWFLEYASYVILERAVPHLNDGLKPVQRRILHAMKQLDDGRYNKVANIIGHTMQYHPHGDASIGDALVQLGQKDLLIDMQGNWGNILTGDSAAAPRYIEARLSKFALDVLFNPKTTEWKLSYDGRNKEPITLPVKFPLLLAQGVEGIAVGLASKILPHNFLELIDASIKHLQGEDFDIYPDFLSGGMVDVTKYNQGVRGSKIRVRAKIIKVDKKTLAITEIPFGKTTGTLIDSIIAANDKNKIKIKKIDDNTAANVEILIHLLPNTSPDITIDALYAFTDCEVSISPNSCIIEDNKPKFLPVKDILRTSVENTRDLLKLELEIKLHELNEAWHLSSLEKIFIENRIYLSIEDCESWEDVLQTIDNELEPYKHLLKRTVTQDDIVRLTEIKIKRISRYDGFKAEEHLKSIEAQIIEVNYHLAHITEFSIKYFRTIKEKYGKGKERKTEIRYFDVIEASEVAVANEKLYVNRAEGFVGTGLKKDEYICDCSDIDDIIVFRKDGTYMVVKVADKLFVGKNIIHVAVFKRNDERTIYNAVYLDGNSENYYVKRFAVTSINRDKEYNLTMGTEGSKVLHFTVNPNGEAETIRVVHKPKKRLRIHAFEYDFSILDIKGRNTKGNLLTKHGVFKITLKERGESTLKGRELWYDVSTQKIYTEERGQYLGEFEGDDKLIVFNKNGTFTLLPVDLAVRYTDDVIRIEKYSSDTIYSAIFYDAEKVFQNYYLKRFQVEEELVLKKEYSFIGEHPGSKLIDLSDDKLPRTEITFGGDHLLRESEVIAVKPFIAVKSFKAHGKRLSQYEIATVKFVEPLPDDEDGVMEDETGTDDEIIVNEGDTN